MSDITPKPEARSTSQLSISLVMVSTCYHVQWVKSWLAYEARSILCLAFCQCIAVVALPITALGHYSFAFLTILKCLPASSSRLALSFEQFKESIDHSGEGGDRRSGLALERFEANTKMSNEELGSTVATGGCHWYALTERALGTKSKVTRDG
jgi:hypothetical protein